MTMPARVRIYKPAKAATQSGRARTAYWVIEHPLETPRRPESLMGWISSADTLNQPRLIFATVNEAVEFARKNGWDYEVVMPKARRLKGRSYQDNFRYTPPPADKKA